jgi:predicted small metal-binding protein
MATEATMKTMTCRQLGGACDKEFRASSFAEIAEMSKQHGMAMFQARDGAHVEAMNEMSQLMQKPNAMTDWFERKQKEFEATPDTQ